jgi:prolyl 4-hydroxylase
VSSRLSVLIYLNDDYEGGHTNFLDGNNKQGPTKIAFSVQPVTGTAIIFEHHLLHEGEILKKGVKYILRTDIMYYRPGKGRPLQEM